MPFPYFGRKTRIAHLYPYPIYDTIIEPFAGSAGYSMAADHWTRQVVLVEIDPAIADLWRWLIDPATTRDTIMGLPDMAKGQDLREIYPTPGDPAKTLARLTAATGNYSSAHKVTEWMERDWTQLRARVASEVHKVKHWTIIEGDYTRAPDIEATWHIDPPYQKISHGYGTTRDGIDFDALGQWCQTRRGQVMVCEESGADWLPFTPLTQRTTIVNTPTVEVIWTNHQVTLF